MQPFPASRSLEFIGTDIFRPFTKSVQNSQHILFITDPYYSKLARAVPASKKIQSGRLEICSWINGSFHSAY